MTRLLLTAAILFSLVISLLILPPAAEARRCDDAPPETLLSLYRASTEIHIGKYDRVEDGAVVETTDDYTAVELLKHYSVSSTLKGEPRKFYTAVETDYRYKPTGEEPQPAEEDEHGADPANEIKAGDDVLIFLKKDEESGKLVLSHYRDAVRKVRSGELSTYEAAIRDLNSIFGKKKVDEAGVVAWLVETAVDPVTRWDGAFELLSGYQTAEWMKEREETIAGKRARGEKLEEWEETDETDELAKQRAGYSKLLTDAQKKTLLEAAIEVPSAEGSEDAEAKAAAYPDGDGVLIELVSRWGGKRYAAFLVDRLRTNPSAEYWANANMMSLAAKAISSESLTGLAEKFGRLYAEDKESLSDEDAAEFMPPVKDGEPVQPRITYGELRAKLMADFLAAAEKNLTTAAR